MNKRTKAIAKAFLLSGIGTVVTAIAAGSLSKSKSTPAKVLSVGASALAGLAIFYGESERFTSESLISLQHEMIDDLQESKEKLWKENAALEDEKWTLEMEKWDLDRENFNLKWDKEIAKLEDDEEELDECSSNLDIRKTALKKAEDYLSRLILSKARLIKQLKNEGFTEDEARYAADNVNVDWATNAAESAEEWMRGEHDNYSEDNLTWFLKMWEEYTDEEVAHAVAQVWRKKDDYEV